MASYNCSDSVDQTYGAGAYSVCGTSQTNDTSVGAPNTGVFEQFLGSGSFTILVPLIGSIIIVLIATVIIQLRKKMVKRISTGASPSPSHDE